MRLHNLAIALAAVGCFAAFTATTAKADNIVLTSAPSINFTGNGSGALTFSSAGGSGNATLNLGGSSISGTTLFGALSGATGTESGGIFTITSGGTQTFSFTGGGDSLSGTITWVGIKDGTSTPQFDVGSFLTVGSVSGGSAFMSDFPVGSKDEIDMTLNASTYLSTLSFTTNSESLSFSSGQILSAPEPSTLAMLAMGLLAAGLAGGFLRRREDSVA